MNYETLSRSALVNHAVTQAYQIESMEAALEVFTARIRELETEVAEANENLDNRDALIDFQDSEIDNMKIMIDTSQIALQLALGRTEHAEYNVNRLL